METQELHLLKGFEEDSRWFHDNIFKLREEGFTGKFVAIKNKKVVSSNKDTDSLIEAVEKEGENPSYVFIEFVHPEGYTLIL